MKLADQVIEALRTRQNAAGFSAQSDRIATASKLFDDLASKGLVEVPTYKLAPMNAVPPKAMAMSRGKQF